MKTDELEKVSTDVLSQQGDRLGFTPLSDIGSYVVYKELKQWLGEPSDAFIYEAEIEWEWVIRFQEFILNVFKRENREPYLGIYSKTQDAESARMVASEFIALLAKEAKHFQNKLSNIDEERIKGFYIENLYAIYLDTANALLADATFMLQERGVITAKVENSCRGAFFFYVAAFEGFLNLIYEIYLKPKFRLYKIPRNLRQAKIEAKISLIPAYCYGFKEEPINAETNAFLDFIKIYELRNTIIHGNLTSPMTVPIIVEDGHEFPLPQPAKSAKEFPRTISEFDPLFIQNVQFATQEMVNQILESMFPRYRSALSKVLNNDVIRVGKDEKEYFIDI